MTRVLWLVALVPLLCVGPAACSKFGAASDDTPDAADVPDAAPAETGGGTVHRIYAYGGVNVNAPTATPVMTAYLATVAPNGDLGAWTPAGALRNDRYAAAWLQNGDTVVAAGGALVGTRSSADVRQGALPSDPVGGVNVWSTGASLATGRRYASAAAHGSNVYVSGGRNDTNAVGNIERNDGTTTKWTPSGSLPASLAGHATFIRDSKFYVVGGDPVGASVTASVKRAGFTPDGSVDAFMTAGDLPTAVARHAIALINPWLFVIGGDGSGGTALAIVQRGTFDVNGMLSWDLLDPLVLPTGQKGIAEACTVVIDHTIYLIGGRDVAAGTATNTVHIGRVGADGTIAWKTSPNTLPEGRAAFGCAVSPSSAP